MVEGYKSISLSVLSLTLYFILLHAGSWVKGVWVESAGESWLAVSGVYWLEFYFDEVWQSWCILDLG